MPPVIVHGTKFSVERVAAVGAQQSGTRVRVIEGVVTVDTYQGQRTLTAGMELMTPGPLTQDALPSPDVAPASATSASAAMAGSEGPPAGAGSSPPSTLGAENALLAEAMRLRRERHENRALALIDALAHALPRLAADGDRARGATAGARGDRRDGSSRTGGRAVPDATTREATRVRKPAG